MDPETSQARERERPIEDGAKTLSSNIVQAKTRATEPKQKTREDRTDCDNYSQQKTDIIVIGELEG
jgi:hypothetical protein